MTKDKSRRILERLKKFYGQPHTELQFNNIYELTISVVLSAQTTDKQVNSVTPNLFKRFPDFRSLSRARLSEVESIIRRTGFYKNKAKYIVRLSKTVSVNYSDILPHTRKELTALPGIGRKSANVILSVGFDIPALAVDTHVMRIAGRLGYSNSKVPDHIEKALTSVIPENEWKTTHMVLIKHGRTLCKARNPLCIQCTVRTFCSYGKSSHNNSHAQVSSK